MPDQKQSMCGGKALTGDMLSQGREESKTNLDDNQEKLCFKNGKSENNHLSMVESQKKLQEE